MTGKSLTPNEILLSQLKELMPQAFNEGKLDKEKLLVSLGENIDISNERYVLNWAGKSDCFRVLQSPSSRTLVPAKEESINFDETENIFIEGENLEVLKILQKSYFGKIKMIYIDPPYNTGNDSFIYPDKFSEGKDEYLKRVGDKDEEGYMTKEGMFRKNSKENGQYHSNWLSMMYPRLFLARNLLRDDGVIFISIDDNEVHNLRLMMNEIFGEENYLAELIWKKKYIGGKHAKHFVDFHEYIIAFAKNIDSTNEFLIDRPEIEKGKFELLDEFFEERGKYYIRPLKSNLGLRETLIYPIQCPDGTTINTQWMVAENTYFDLVKNGRIIFKKGRDGNYNIYRKFYEYDGDGKVKVPSIIDDVANANGKIELKDIFDIKEGRDIPFENPKPIGLLKYLIQPTLSSDDVILDYFSGSATTAHAILDMNKVDGDKRKFIVVQLPEPCDETTDNFKSSCKTIADIGKERIRRVIKKIKEEESGKLGFDDKKLDLGFKVLKLADSSFKQWRTDIKTEDDLKNQMKLFTDPTREGSTPLDMVYELILKSGKDINSSIVHKNNVYYINETEMAILIEKVDGKTIDALIEKHPDKVIILDKLFKGNDSLKTNTALQMKDAGIEFKTI